MDPKSAKPEENTTTGEQAAPAPETTPETTVPTIVSEEAKEEVSAFEPDDCFQRLHWPRISCEERGKLSEKMGGDNICEKLNPAAISNEISKDSDFLSGYEKSKYDSYSPKEGDIVCKRGDTNKECSKVEEIQSSECDDKAGCPKFELFKWLPFWIYKGDWVKMGESNINQILTFIEVLICLFALMIVVGIPATVMLMRRR